MKAKLTVNELNYLKTIGAFSAVSETVCPVAKGDQFELTLHDDSADLIRDLCGERLQREGFDENYELTTTGKLCESLIDKLFTGGESAG